MMIESCMMESWSHARSHFTVQYCRRENMILLFGMLTTTSHQQPITKLQHEGTTGCGEGNERRMYQYIQYHT
jgi:hypothetical protein